MSSNKFFDDLAATVKETAADCDIYRNLCDEVELVVQVICQSDHVILVENTDQLLVHKLHDAQVREFAAVA